ncbi:hypothetical protein HK105_204735 [Polyrhizophydium stewartii]|uniref:Uncharacterized protein n=1 Tax=Polyrhizophydium stewartii TaxID=2732419 RepID=A0ABR4N8C5_9FUNG
MTDAPIRRWLSPRHLLGLAVVLLAQPLLAAAAGATDASDAPPEAEPVPSEAAAAAAAEAESISSYYSTGVTQSWYLPVGAPRTLEFVGRLEDANMLLVTTPNSFALLNRTDSGFRTNITLAGDETFKHVAFDYPSLVTLSGPAGEYVGGWDPRTGSSYFRTEITIQDEDADADGAYDVAFVTDENTGTNLIATLHGGRQVTGLSELGEVQWTFTAPEPSMVFFRIMVSPNGYLLMGARGDEHLLLMWLDFGSGIETRRRLVRLPAAMHASAPTRSDFVVFGDAGHWWAAWRDERGRVVMYSVHANRLKEVPDEAMEYLGNRGILGLVELGSPASLMRDFVVQYEGGVDLLVQVEHDSEDPHVRAVFLPETYGRSVVFSQVYEPDFFALARLQVDEYDQMILEFNEMDTGELIDSKVLFPAFKGIIVKGFMTYRFNNTGEKVDETKTLKERMPTWILVGMDHNGHLVSYDNTQIISTVAADDQSQAPLDAPPPSDPIDGPVAESILLDNEADGSSARDARPKFKMHMANPDGVFFSREIDPETVKSGSPETHDEL